MTDKEELEMVLRLINKHHLPLSPILEYAIRERIEAYNDYCDTNKFQVCEGLSMQNSNGLEWYVNRFSSMSVNITNNKKAPNKEILLLAIIDMIQYGNLIENRIPHNKLMSDSFAIQWQKWFPKTKTPYVWFPFYHLKSESFWHFKQYGDDNIQFKLYERKNTMPISTLRTLVEYAYLDDALFHYMHNSETRSKLKEVLIRNYIKCE